jgi:hypothetical protein
VVAARHEGELPEIYVDSGLVYPRVDLGSLALGQDRLGLRTVDHECGHDDDHMRKEGTMGMTASDLEG